MVGQQNKPQLLKGLEIGDREGTNLDSMQPKAALRNGQPAPAQARSGWIMRFVFRTAGPSSQLIWTAVIQRNQKDSHKAIPRSRQRRTTPCRQRIPISQSR